MITGDYHQTAVAVAWGVGMVPPGGIVHVIDKLPAAAEVSPPSTPVQIASTNSLFPGELDGLSRQPSQAWTSWRPAAKKENGTTLDMVFTHAANFGRHMLFSSQSSCTLPQLLQLKRTHVHSHGLFSHIALSQPVSVPCARCQPQRKHATALTHLYSMLQVTNSLRSTLEHSLESQNSAHFPLQCDGQRFLLGTGDTRQDHEATRALTSIAEGHAQCAITGAAFEHLLQQEDLAVLRAVLQNAVVFARMRPHQKAQVLSLLGTAGLHQAFQGSHRHIPVGHHKPVHLKESGVWLLRF